MIGWYSLQLRRQNFRFQTTKRDDLSSTVFIVRSRPHFEGVIPAELRYCSVSLPFTLAVFSLYSWCLFPVFPDETFSGFGRMSPRYDSPLCGETPVATR